MNQTDKEFLSVIKVSVLLLAFDSFPVWRTIISASTYRAQSTSISIPAGQAHDSIRTQPRRLSRKHQAVLL